MAKAQLKSVEAVDTDPLAGLEELVLDQTPGSEKDAHLEDLLGELESGLSGVPATMNVVGDAALVPTEQEMIQAGHTLMIDDLKAQAALEVAEQGNPAPDDAQMPLPAGTTKKAAPVTKRIATMGMKKSEALVKALGARSNEFLLVDLKYLSLTEEQQSEKIQTLLDEVDSNTPIKIQEKVVNLFAHLANGASLSNYTKMAVALLVKDGELTSKSLKDAYIARPYTEGTASSQATQMMKLLPMMGIATRTAGKLVVNPDSTLLPSLSA